MPHTFAAVILTLSSVCADYGNNSLVVPPRTPRPDAVAILLYYCDLETAGGPTHFAPAHGKELTEYSDDAPFNPPNLPRQTGRSPELLERLYMEERPVRYRQGTAAVYRLGKLDAWFPF